MKKYFTLKKTLIYLTVLLVLIQFVRIDKTTQPANADIDFILSNKTSPANAAVLKESCYDCHSNEARYPWYTNVAPISWWIKHHINEGSHHLNFSEWGNYKSRRQDHKLEECVEMLQEDEMPLGSYVLMHGQAALSKAQKDSLIVWFNSLRTHESDEPEK